jgi:hypothetical protein
VRKQLVCATLHFQVVGIDFHVGRASREEGKYCQGATKESGHTCQNL